MPSTSIEAVALRFYEAFRPGHIAIVRNVLSPEWVEWVDHTLPPGREPGVAGMQSALQRLHGLLPDLTATVIKMISSGNMVAAHLAFTGTHEGTLLGATPSHRPVSFIAFDIHHISGHHIVESWHLEDNLGLLTQIGVIPPLA